MENVLLDAGPLIAVLDRNEPRHAWVVEQMRAVRGRLSTVWPAVAEACHLLQRVHSDAPAVLLETLSARKVGLVPMDTADLWGLGYLMDRYRRLPMDLAAAALVYALSRGGYSAIMTFDRDFTVYRAAGRPLPLLAPFA